MVKRIVELKDMAGWGRRMKCEIVASDLGIEIRAKGLGTKTEKDGAPIYVELFKGQLRVVVWANIKQEDPTHIVPLDKARERNHEI